MLLQDAERTMAHQSSSGGPRAREDAEHLANGAVLTILWLRSGFDLHHWTDNVLVSELGEFAFASGVVKRWHGGQSGRLGWRNRNGVSTIASRFRSGQVVIPSPLGFYLGPFLLREFERF